jgi:acetyltransferase-like isoleucine patch superfamily enzyme
MGVGDMWDRWRTARRHRRTFATARSVGTGARVLGDPIVDGTDLEIGDRFQIWSAHRQTIVSGPGAIRIGTGVFINVGVMVYAEVGVTIGDDVALANEVYVMDTSSHGIEGGDPRAAPVRIGDGTWVGARAIILPGVTIGRRVVVGAGAVVSRDVPDDVLVAGNPARVVRPLTYPRNCKRAWHDNFCYCPGSYFGPAVETVPDPASPTPVIHSG